MCCTGICSNLWTSVPSQTFCSNMARDVLEFHPQYSSTRRAWDPCSTAQSRTECPSPESESTCARRDGSACWSTRRTTPPTRLNQHDPIGVKCRWKRGCAKPTLDRRGLVGGVVVEHQMQIQTRRGLLVQGFEERLELLGAVAAMQQPDHLSRGHIEGRRTRQWCRRARSCKKLRYRFAGVALVRWYGGEKFGGGAVADGCRHRDVAVLFEQWSHVEQRITDGARTDLEQFGKDSASA